VFDQDGRRAGPRSRAGFYPDDLAVAPDGRHLLVLSSGQAEGSQEKPRPALDVVALDPKGDSHRTVGHVALDPIDDPERLTISASGRFAAILLAKSKAVVAIDLTSPDSPHVIGQVMPPRADAPYVSYSPEGDWIIMPVAGQTESVAIDAPASRLEAETGREATQHHRAAYLVCTRPRDSVLELLQSSPRRSLGRLPLKGPFNLSWTRPSGLAYSADRGLLAVATRSGTIHLIELKWRANSDDPKLDRIATSPENQARR
jgi:hypothetical protein